MTCTCACSLHVLLSFVCRAETERGSCQMQMQAEAARRGSVHMLTGLIVNEAL